METVKCVQCDKPFEQTKDSHVFCSNACKKVHSRRIGRAKIKLSTGDTQVQIHRVGALDGRYWVVDTTRMVMLTKSGLTLDELETWANK